MKILDRYIIISVAGAFFFGIAMFMALLLAMDLLRQLVELIAQKGVPVATALAIFGYRIPSMLVYAFPMSMLLSILLVFNRMSSDSEMVAIRAAGVSFVRIVIPTLFFAVVVTACTFWLSDRFVPFATKRAAQLTVQALKTVKSNEAVKFQHLENGEILYSVEAANLDMNLQQMHKVSLLLYQNGEPFMLIYAENANWDPLAGRWRFPHASPVYVSPHRPTRVLMQPLANSELDLEAYVLRLRESPFDLSVTKRDPEAQTSDEMRGTIAHLEQLGQKTGLWQMGLRQRYSVPVYCLIFALIGAPLGLRSHRTSSAVGLGISLLVVFSFYFFSVYLSMFGENNRIPPSIAAWTPNVIGALVGIVLIWRANQ